MVTASTALNEAERCWKSGRDVEMRAAMTRILSSDWNDPSIVLEIGIFALKSRQFLYVIDMLRSALTRFPEDARFADLLVDVHFQIGDADRALEAYAAALARGLPAQTEAVRRVTRVAIFCGRLDELEVLLGDPSSAAFQAESRAMLDQEKVSFRLFEVRREREIGDAGPTVADIRAATQQGDLPYATHLYLCAVRSVTISEADLLRVAYESFPPSGAVPAILGFISWQLLRRFPENALSQLEVAINGLLQFGDAEGAKLMLEKALHGTGYLDFPGSADRLVRLATSCCVFGNITQRHLAEICGQHWHLLRQPSYAILANAFAARSAMLAARPALVRGHERPRIAICVSGQLRNYSVSWPTISREVEKLNARVFLSTWESVGAGLGTGDSVGRRLPASIRDRLPASFQTREFFSERYPTTFNLFGGAERVRAEDCRISFDTEHVRVHDEKDFESRLDDCPGLMVGGSLNQAKMYFGIHDAISLMREWEDANGERFDVVVRIRPDLTIRSIDEEDIAIALTQGIALSTHLRLGAVGDIFLVMAREIADILHGMWPSIHAAKSFAIVPGASGAAAETAMFESLCWNGIKILQLRGSQALALNSVMLSPEALWQALAKDLSLRTSHDEVDLRVASVISEAAGYGNIPSLQQLSAINHKA